MCKKQASLCVGVMEALRLGMAQNPTFHSSGEILRVRLRRQDSVAIADGAGNLSRRPHQADQSLGRLKPAGSGTGDVVNVNLLTASSFQYPLLCSFGRIAGST